jgi:hypothetical protein
MRYLLLAALLGACASTEPQSPTAAAAVDTAPHPGGASFATREECEMLVDHLDEVRFLSRPEPDVFRAHNQSPDWHRARVDECTITVDKRDLACLMRSRDLTTSSLCGSRFFASTLQSYRS